MTGDQGYAGQREPQLDNADGTAVGGGATAVSGWVSETLQTIPDRWTLADENLHPGAAIEWWFVHGSVRDLNGSRTHFMVSLFRHRLKVGSELPDQGHAALLTVLEEGVERHQVSSWVDEAVVSAVAARPGLSQCSNIDRRLLEAFFEEIRGHGPPRGIARRASTPLFGLESLCVEWDGLRIEQHDSSLHLAFEEPVGGRTWNLCLVPESGRTVIPAASLAGRTGHGMEMVTYPQLAVRGDVDGSAVGGTAWFDHQWGGRGWFFADGDMGRALGWEWLGISLDDGRDLVVMVHRDMETDTTVFDHAYLRSRDGVERHAGGVEMTPLRFWESPRTLIRHPVSWQVHIPSLETDLVFEPLVDDQEVPVFGLARAIWEGAGRVHGTVGGKKVSGPARGEVYGRGFVFNLKDHLESLRERIDGRIEGFFPRVLQESHLEGYIGNPQWQYEPNAYREMLTGPVWDLVARRGKRWRPMLGLLMLDALGCDPKPYEELVSVLAELIHTGALIIDDIQDKSLLRRGDQCIHLRYGDDVAISAANTLYFLPSVVVSRHPLLTQAQRLALHETTAEQLLAAHLGQALDLWWSRNMEPDQLRLWMGDSLEARILQMYAQKTAAPLVGLAKITSVLSNADDATAKSCIDFARSLGVAYQIIDDIQNYSTSPEWRKTCGEDLAEGKMTIVLYRALQRLRGRDRRRLEEIACSPGLRCSPEDLAEGAALIRGSGAIEACRDRAMKIVDGCWRELSGHLEPSEAKIVLRALWGALLDQELPP